MRNNEAFLMFLAGLGTGAALMYFMDPDRGGRRRALVMDKAVSLTNDAREAFEAPSQDLSNRAYGLYAETRKAVGSPLPHSDRWAQTNTGQEKTSETGNITEAGNTAETTNTTGNVTEIGRSATTG